MVSPERPSRWLEPLHNTRARADRFLAETRRSLLGRVRNVTGRLPGSWLWAQILDRWTEPQMEFEFKEPPLTVTEVNVGVSDLDPGRMTSAMRFSDTDGDAEEVELEELVDQTVELMGEAASNMAAMLEDLELVDRKQRKIIIECCRYFHEVYDYLKEEN